MPSWTVVWEKHDSDVPQATCVGNVRSWSCGVRAKLVSVLPFSCAYGRPVLRFSRAELQWSIYYTKHNLLQTKKTFTHGLGGYLDPLQMMFIFV